MCKFKYRAHQESKILRLFRRYAFPRFVFDRLTSKTHKEGELRDVTWMVRARDRVIGVRVGIPAGVVLVIVVAAARAGCERVVAPARRRLWTVVKMRQVLWAVIKMRQGLRLRHLHRPGGV